MARILVIEDNPENLELMTYLLAAFGHTTMTADTGTQGIDQAAKAPDLIACDVQLPDIDGYEVVRRLKADPALKEIPVIAVTALAMVADREKGLRHGFDGYIAKPIDPESFVQQIEQFLPPEKRGRAPAETADSDAPGVTPRERFASILVVDDSPTNRELIYQTLAPFGFDVHLAHTVPVALDMLMQREGFDLILSDLHMPGEDGFNLVRRVKADPRLARLPFMFISSSVWGESERRTALTLGVSRFLLRPIEPQQLLDEVIACLSRHREVAYGEDPGR